MKEARIDEVLDNIAAESLVYLPGKPLPPSKLIELNVEHRKMKEKEIELKSSTAERAVIELINKFLDVITQPDLQEGKYDWLDPNKALKPVGSTSKIHMGEEAGK